MKQEIIDMVQSAEWQCEHNTEFVNGYKAAMQDVWWRITGERLEIEDKTNTPANTTKAPF